MVRQLLFVVTAGFLVVFGGLGAVDESVGEAGSTNATDSVVQVVAGVSTGINGILLGMIFLVMLSAVLMVMR